MKKVHFIIIKVESEISSYIRDKIMLPLDREWSSLVSSLALENHSDSIQFVATLWALTGPSVFFYGKSTILCLIEACSIFFLMSDSDCLSLSHTEVLNMRKKRFFLDFFDCSSWQFSSRKNQQFHQNIYDFFDFYSLSLLIRVFNRGVAMRTLA